MPVWGETARLLLRKPRAALPRRQVVAVAALVCTMCVYTTGPSARSLLGGEDFALREEKTVEPPAGEVQLRDNNKQGVEKDGAPFDATGGAGAEAVQLEDVEKGFLGMWAHEYQVRHATPSPGAPPPPSPAVLNNNQGAIIEAMRADADEHGKDLTQGLETDAATGALARAAARAATEDIEHTEVGLDSSKKIWWGGDRTCMEYI